ncbi:MAG: hypothetical protein AAF993_18385 [Pseudomonadota bacterium]
MSQRQQPDLSTAESSNYRRGGKRSAKPGRSGGNSGGVGRQLGSNLIMAILVAGLVLAGWFIANQQQVLVAEQARLSAADDRLKLLEARLSATDSALAQEGEDTSEKIGLWESEIRKLWAVSNERNKKWIQDNQKAVKSLTGSLDGIKAANRDMQAAVGRHDAAFDQQQALVDQLTSLELQMQQVVRGQRDLVDKVNTASQSVASLRATLASKVDDNAEAIQSIDAYRVAVNSRLADIERRLGGVAGVPGG